MGCGGSKEASPAQKAVTCELMCHDMAKLCIGPALANADKIVINMPPEFSKMTEARDKLRSLAADQVGDEPSQGGKKTSTKGGGRLMGMLNEGLSAAEKAVDKIGDVIDSGIAAVLNSLADALDKAMEGIETPMSTMGKDLVTDKQAQITKIMITTIANSKFEEPVSLVWGSNTCITEFVVKKAKDDLSQRLQLAIDEYAKEHNTIRLWDGAVNKYNEAVEKAKQAGVADKLKLDAIQLDIMEYICEQSIQGMRELMGTEETRLRASPQNQNVKCPVVFMKVFSRDILLTADYETATQTARESRKMSSAVRTTATE